MHVLLWKLFYEQDKASIDFLLGKFSLVKLNMNMCMHFFNTQKGIYLSTNFSFVPFRFVARLLAWALSRVVGASVRFRVGGWKCLRDVVVKFKKVLSILFCVDFALCDDIVGEHGM